MSSVLQNVRKWSEVNYICNNKEIVFRITSKLSRFIRLIWIVMFILIGMASINETRAMDHNPPDSTWNDWKFRISPYFWYIGLKGTIYRPPQPANYPIPPPPKYEIDVGFKDIRNSIKFAIMIGGQYKTDKVVAQFNLSSLILESEAITPLELLLQDNILKLTYFSGDFAVGYRALKKPKWQIEPLITFKYVYFDIGLKTNLAGNVPVEGEVSRFWFDPAIGFNARYLPTPKVELAVYADYGPDWPDNKRTAQFIGLVNYNFTKTFQTSLGYRSYYVNFPKDEAIFNGNLHGWIMKLSFRF